MLSFYLCCKNLNEVVFFAGVLGYNVEQNPNLTKSFHICTTSSFSSPSIHHDRLGHLHHHRNYQSLIVKEDVLGNVELTKGEAAVPHHRRVLPGERHHCHDNRGDSGDDENDKISIIG